MRPRKHSPSILWQDARLSLALFACAAGTLLACQAVAVGLAGRYLPWIVIVTSLPWVPLPGQVAQTAAVFALVAAACAPLERHRRWRRSGRMTYARRVQFGDVTAASRRHTRRHTYVAGALITVAMVAVAGGAGAILAAGSARTQPIIVRDALRTQQRGATALAFETLEPAASGQYDPAKFGIYFLVSGWALDLHDWSSAARLSTDLMKAAAAKHHPRSLIAGLFQYELAVHGVVPPALVRAIVMSAPSGHWRTSVRLLLQIATSGATRQLESAVDAAERRLRPPIRNEFLEAATVLQHYISAGILPS